MAEDDRPAPKREAPPVREGYSRTWDYVILAVLAVVLGVLLAAGVIPLLPRG
jgi:hypothetical protein